MSANLKPKQGSYLAYRIYNKTFEKHMSLTIYKKFVLHFYVTNACNGGFPVQYKLI